MVIGALSGYTIAITADRRCEEQAELIARRGGVPLAGAVIRTLPLSDEPELELATLDLIDHPPDVVVLCTGVGARGWFSAAEALGLDGGLMGALGTAEVVARSPKAAGAAVALDLPVGWVAPGATYREVVDHMSSRPSTRSDGTPVRVAVQLDGHDSSGMCETLAEYGYQVVGVRAYRWMLPDDTGPAERLVAAVADGVVDAVTFTSARAVTNFVDIARRSGEWDRVIGSLNRDVVVCCVGPVTAAAARSVGVAEVVEPTRPRLGAMVQALVRAFEGRSIALELNGVPVLLQGRLVVVGDSEPIRLTERERAVLEELARQPGAVVSKQALNARVWSGAADDHVVEVTVGRLRRRLGLVGSAIDTVMRRGYRLDVG